jgi:hypothetical protein
MAGSRKGIPNKPKRRLLQLIQEKYPNFEPVLELVDIYHDTEQDYNVRISCLKEAIPYLEPKLKQVEVQSEVNHSITLTVADQIRLAEAEVKK